MQTIKLAAVEYLNTLPFVHGLAHSPLRQQLAIHLAPPSLCADMLVAGEVDLALVPVATLARLPEARIISDYCIGANGAVETVALFSTLPAQRLKRIYLDTDSRTSVALLRILAQRHWEIQAEFLELRPGQLDAPKRPEDGFLLIGDKVFTYQHHFEYAYDLAQAWQDYTRGLPFVFALWVATRDLPAAFLRDFNEALALGLSRIPQMLSERELSIAPEAALHYLTHAIDYRLDEAKRMSIARYLHLLSTIPQGIAPGYRPKPKDKEDSHDYHLL